MDAQSLCWFCHVAAHLVHFVFEDSEVRFNISRMYDGVSDDDDDDGGDDDDDDADGDDDEPKEKHPKK